MLQNRIHILCTRNIDNALIEHALSGNVAIDVISFIKTEHDVTTELWEKVEDASMKSDALAFTSSNAVEAIATHQDLQKSRLVGHKIFCIGHATKQCVVKYFGEKSVAGSADNARELANAIITAHVKNLIFFCGDQRRDELPELLKKDNIEVKEFIVYKTIITPKRIEKKYDGILFFSPSAVKGFFQANQLKDETVLFAVGDTTAEEIKKFSKNKILVSDVPEKKSLLNRAISYFQTNPIHH